MANGSEWLLLLLATLAHSALATAPSARLQRHPPDVLAQVYVKPTCAPACSTGRPMTVQTTVSGLAPGARYNVVYGLWRGNAIVHFSAEQLERSSTHEQRYLVRLHLDLPPLQAGTYSFGAVVYDPFPGLDDEEAFLTQAIIAITIGDDAGAVDEISGAAPSFDSAGDCKRLDEHTVSTRLQVPLRRINQMLHTETSGSADGARLWEKFLFMASDFTLSAQCSWLAAEGAWHGGKAAWAQWLPTSYASLGLSALLHNVPHLNKSFADGEIDIQGREEALDVEVDKSRSERGRADMPCDDKIWDIPVAIMSQAHDTARQASTLALLRELGFRNATLAPTIKWTQVDVERMTADGLLSPQLFQRMAKRKHETTDDGQIRYTANALSQIQRIRAAAEDGEPVIILEDDLMSGDSVPEVRRRMCSALSNLPPSADMVYLEYCLESCVDVRYNARYSGLGKASYPSCAAAILFTAKGARRVSDLCLPVFDVVDRMYPLIIHTGWVDAYILTPAVMYQDAIHRSNWAGTNSYWLDRRGQHQHGGSMHRVREDAPLCWEVNVLRNGGEVQGAEGVLSLHISDAKCDRRQVGLVLPGDQVEPMLSVLEGMEESRALVSACVHGQIRGQVSMSGDLAEIGQAGTPVGTGGEKEDADGLSMGNSEHVWLAFPVPEACGQACVAGSEGEITYATRSKDAVAQEHRVGRWQMGSQCGVLLDLPPNSACFDLEKGQMCRIVARVASRVLHGNGVGSSTYGLASAKSEEIVETIEFDVPLLRIRLGKQSRESHPHSQSAGHSSSPVSAPVSVQRQSVHHPLHFPDQNQVQNSEDDYLELLIPSEALQELESVNRSSSQSDMWIVIERLKRLVADTQRSMSISSSNRMQPKPTPPPPPPPPPRNSRGEKKTCDSEMLESSAGREEGIVVGVTFAAVATLDRCLTALYSTAHWDGAMSLAFYARSDLELEAIRAFAAESWAPLCRKYGKACSAVVLSNCSSTPVQSPVLPINILRRAAVSLAVTDLVFYADIDFIPSAGAAELVRQHYMRTRDSQQLLVLPCFWAMPNMSWQPFMAAGPGGQVSVTVEDLSKRRLMQSLTAGEISPSFSSLESLGHSHGPTNYPAWLALQDTDAPYRVEYTLWYEPYFAVNITAWRGIHAQKLFSDLFRFGGGDKAQLSLEAAILGYTFLVHPGAYILHVPVGFWRKEVVPRQLLSRVFAQELDRYNRENAGQPQQPIFKEPSGLIMHSVTDFLASMPVWEVGSVLASGPVCFPLPLAALRKMPAALAEQLLEASFEASTRRITSSLLLYHSNSRQGRTDGLYLDDEEGSVKQGSASSSNSTNRARVLEDVEAALPASRTLSCAYWEACLGAFLVEAAYCECSFTPARGAGGLRVEKRLLEGWTHHPSSPFSPLTCSFSASGILNQASAAGNDGDRLRVEHELMHSKYGLDGMVSAISLEVLEVDEDTEGVLGRETGEVVLALAVGAGMLHARAQQGQGPKAPIGGGRHGLDEERSSVLLSCKLLTSLVAPDGTLLQRVQRDLFVSVPEGCQGNSLDRCYSIPPVLSAYCGPLLHHKHPHSSGSTVSKEYEAGGDMVGGEAFEQVWEPLEDDQDRIFKGEQGESMGGKEDKWLRVEAEGVEQHDQKLKRLLQAGILPKERSHPVDKLASAFLKEVCELWCLAGKSIPVSSTVSGLVPGARYDIVFTVLHGTDPVHVTSEQASVAEEMSDSYSVRHLLEIPPLTAGSFSVAVFVYDAFSGLEVHDAFLTKCVIALKVLES